MAHNPVTCDEVQRQLPLYVLDEAPVEVAEAMTLHLAQCRDCRETQRNYLHITNKIAQMAHATEASPQLRQRCLAAVATASMPGTGARHRVWTLRVCGLAVAACAAAAVVLWRVNWNNNAPQPTPTENVVVMDETVTEIWHTAAGGADRGQSLTDMASCGGLVYFIARGEVAAVVAADAATGVEYWRTAMSCPMQLLADDSGVYCLSQHGRTATITALNWHDGAERWEQTAPTVGILQDAGKIAMLADTVGWVRGGEAVLLDAVSGIVRWQHDFAGEERLSMPVRAGEQLYLAGDRALYCLDAASGAELWRQSDPRNHPPGTSSTGLAATGNIGPHRAVLVLMRGQAFVLRSTGLDKSRLQCVDLASQKTVWSQTIGAAVSLLATERLVLVRDRGITTFDAASGRRLWQYTAAGCGPLTIDGEMIYFVDSADAGRLVALHAADGSPAQVYRGVQSCNMFIKAGRQGYLRTRDGQVRAIALARRS